MRSPPVWPYALAVSLLLHGLLVFVLLGDPTPVPSVTETLSVEARLIQAARPQAAPGPREAAATPPAGKAATPPATRAAPLADDAETASEGGAVADASDDNGVAEAAAVEEPATDLPTSPDVLAQTPLNPLPSRIDMRFQVRYGIARGEQTLLWVSDGERYTVISVASATGLAGLFYSGRFTQTSQGRIGAQGLVPEMFWDQRGDRRSVARFDAATGTLTYQPEQGAPRQYPYPEGAQDTLSLFFQLALTAPPDGPAEYAVFNGRKLRQYAYALVGEAELETALGTLRTLHLARSGSADGRFEVWLAIDRYYLPVRVLRSDDKGNEIELAVASISP